MTDQDRRKPDEIPASRKSKRGKKAAQRPAITPVEAVGESTSAAAAPGTTMHDAVVTLEHSAPRNEASSANLPVVAAAAALPSPVGLQSIASAYRDYTQKSFAEATTFVEKLTTAPSLDKAVEVQTEFARQACETFAADSRKIRALYRELFWQSLTFPKWPGPAPR